MFELLIKNVKRKFVIESDIILYATDPLILELLDSFNEMEIVIPMLSFTFKGILPLPIPPLPVINFSYKVVLMDSRVFNQTINWQTSPPFDPTMTFDVPSAWKNSELAYHRILRENVINLKQFKLVTKITGDWF